MARGATTGPGGERGSLPDPLLEELRRHSKAIDGALAAEQPNWEQLGGHMRAFCRVLARRGVGAARRNVVSSDR